MTTEQEAAELVDKLLNACAENNVGCTIVINKPNGYRQMSANRCADTVIAEREIYLFNKSLFGDDQEGC